MPAEHECEGPISDGRCWLMKGLPVSRFRGHSLRSGFTDVVKKFNRSRSAKGIQFASRWNEDGTAIGFEVLFWRGQASPTILQVTNTYMQF